MSVSTNHKSCSQEKAKKLLKKFMRYESISSIMNLVTIFTGGVGEFIFNEDSTKEISSVRKIRPI